MHNVSHETFNSIFYIVMFHVKLDLYYKNVPRETILIYLKLDFYN